ncbi:MAG: DNA recombination protein RmuC [Phycisphaerales bacterium]|nr:DNA recombination protein RmuC [Phycisphaerales bacterium]
MGTILAVVFGLAAVVLAGVAAWLWRGLGRLGAEAAGARREAEEASGRLAAALGAAEASAREGAEARARAEGLAGQISGLRVVEAELRKEIESVGREFAERERSLARERAALEARIAEMDTRMVETFEALSAKSLRVASGDFLKLAKEQFEGQQKEDAAELEKRRAAVEQLVKPIGDTLAATRERLESIERARGEQFARFHEQMTQMAGASTGLRDETARLTKALSRPEIRGQYGEIQLRRVAELAGMTSYCDFTEQVSVRDGEDNLLRPDMVVTLPNARVIAVDAKTNTYAYIEAVNAGDAAEREAHLERFARHVAEQAKKLGDKKYWSAWEGSPEFVVMFVPGDHFIDAALARRPELLEYASQHGVILASPSSLIGLLRAVAVGWREARLAEDALELQRLGTELHERAAKVFEYAEGLGRAIKATVDRYNDLAGSMEGRLAVTLRRFEESGVRSGKDVPELPDVTVVPRKMEALPGASGPRALESQ